MFIEDDKVWMTEEELDAFRAMQLETSQKLNVVLMQLCSLLLEQKGKNEETNGHS